MKKRSITNQSLPKLLGIRLSAPIALRDNTGSAVIFHHQRVVHRQISRGLLEIGYRVTALLHDFEDQLIAFFRRSFRIVDESILDLSPCPLVVGLVSLG
jgi:predicted metal-dependent hydrolase